MRRKKPNEPSIPLERQETIRQKIVSILNNNTLSTKDISLYVMIPEKDVYEHLGHIQRNKRDYPLHITPAMCKKCGFIFRKRDKLKKPGKCPVCRSELIQEPLFCIRRKT